MATGWIRQQVSWINWKIGRGGNRGKKIEGGKEGGRWRRGLVLLVVCILASLLRNSEFKPRTPPGSGVWTNDGKLR